jgi:hypothetical protein
MNAMGLPHGWLRTCSANGVVPSFERNVPPGKPVALLVVRFRFCSGKRNDPQDKPGAFSWFFSIMKAAGARQT